MRPTSLRSFVLLILALGALPALGWAEPLLAICGAYPPEMKALRAEFLADEAHGFEHKVIKGVEFWQGRVDGRAVVIFRTGTSIVNATYQLQIALDHFPITHVLFAGVAGGTDPALHVGDVVIPERWAYHDESAYLNEDGKGGYVQSKYVHPELKNFGFIFPVSVRVHPAGGEAVAMPFFAADPALLAVAKTAVTKLPPMEKEGRPVTIEVGGAGVSGSVFLDNAPYREWVFRNWQARCVDMESTALCQVAHANGKPILIIRGLSDLAGQQAGHNPIKKNEASVSEIAARVLRAVIEGLPKE